MVPHVKYGTHIRCGLRNYRCRDSRSHTTGGGATGLIMQPQPIHASDTTTKNNFRGFSSYFAITRMASSTHRNPKHLPPPHPPIIQAATTEEKKTRETRRLDVAFSSKTHTLPRTKAGILGAHRSHCPSCKPHPHPAKISSSRPRNRPPTHSRYVKTCSPGRGSHLGLRRGRLRCIRVF